MSRVLIRQQYQCDVSSVGKHIKARYLPVFYFSRAKQIFNRRFLSFSFSLYLQMTRALQVKPADSESRGGKENSQTYLQATERGKHVFQFI